MYTIGECFLLQTEKQTRWSICTVYGARDTRKKKQFYHLFSITNMNTLNSSDAYVRQPETFTSLAIAGVIKHTNARFELLHHIRICQQINFGDRFLYINPKN